MPIETLELLGMEATPSGKGFKFKTTEGNIWCFDPKTNVSLKGALNEGLVQVSVDRTPDKDDKVFPKFTGFHGPADGPSPSSVAPSPAAPTASPGQAARGGSTPSPQNRNGGYTGDPINHVLITRQVALKVAAELHVNDPEVNVVDTAQSFAEWLIQGLSPYILVDGIDVSHVLPWRKDLRAEANTKAKAELADEVKAKLQAELDRQDAIKAAAAAEADDGIPF